MRTLPYSFTEWGGRHIFFSNTHSFNNILLHFLSFEQGDDFNMIDDGANSTATEPADLMDFNLF